MKQTLLLASVLALVFVSGCINQSVAKASLNAPFQLKFGEVAAIESEELKIKFLNVTEDSRCPSNVECFWRGAATIEIEAFKEDNLIGKFELSDYDFDNHATIADIGEYTIN